MATVAADDPILSRFRAALDGVYGARLDRAMLYGSRGAWQGATGRLRRQPDPG